MATRAPSKTQQVIVGMATEHGVVAVGILQVDRSMTGDRDTSLGRFKYAPSYLKRPDAVALDPIKLPLTDGEFRFASMGGLPSAIRDSAPDNWGRLLIRRYFYAREIEGPLHEVDYLLAAPRDRSGNLHFATGFKSDGTPDWDRHAIEPEALPEAEALAQHVRTVLKDPVGQFGKAYPKELDALLTASGGARPKVNLVARNGTYLIKMGAPGQDTTSNARLEDASIRMAKQVGINVASVGARPNGAEPDLLSVRRFDRDGTRKLQMVSAMTVLGADDDAYKRTNWSYPLLAQELDRWSSEPAKDKEQLFRCMVLRAMLSDGDDHPRNYALIRDPNSASNQGRGGSTLGQWRLSPMYDCVVGRGEGRKESALAMNIGRMGREISEANILSQCRAFGLSTDQAAAIMAEIQQAVLTQFPRVLQECGVSEVDAQLSLRAVAPLNERAQESFVQRLVARMEQRQQEATDAQGDQTQNAPRG
ncbi:type II toxin-antitoxin system HipA family toxin [Pelomonas sp. APW6]|uniref:Type II toxin-antitoxin system HipA family toxin n=1 Tax=Roseateles subflavus TaxID=3053353 RepID=A0ABT7LPW9_9BURK|nr:type II toxin-antitoxin system HipA family toxin [Pelomonas sp. APW6]MDL5034272.1 type II toxin-antitoxin system HipA family toxin [Pelomonas sp. APW6]